MNHNKINQAFLAAYIELEKICSKKLDGAHGVTEYINKLTDMRFAPGREQILPQLIKYRKYRNRIAHEPGALQNIDELAREDVKWLQNLAKTIEKGKDPVSKYLKKAGGEARARALVRTLALAGAALAVIAVIVIVFMVL